METNTRIFLLGTELTIDINLTEFNNKSELGYYGEPNRVWSVTTPRLLDWGNKSERLVYSLLKKYYPQFFEIVRVHGVGCFDQTAAINEIRARKSYSANPEVYDFHLTQPEILNEKLQKEFFDGISDKPPF